jgi:hypothetical protein
MNTLGQEAAKIKIDSPEKIPKIVRLLENPQSILALPGKISLEDHDYLHILLNQDLSNAGEAFVIGFCMGNDPDTHKIHVRIFKFFSQHVYPKSYQFNKKHLIKYNLGFCYGRKVYVSARGCKLLAINKKAINQIKFSFIAEYPVETVRSYLGITVSDLNWIEKKYKQQIKFNEHNTKKWISKKKLASFSKGLKISGSVCTVFGGFILASKLSFSGYGFVILACSSSQLLIASILEKDLILIFYSAAVFFCVDLYGAYRWLLS